MSDLNTNAFWQSAFYPPLLSTLEKYTGTETDKQTVFIYIQRDAFSCTVLLGNWKALIFQFCMLRSFYSILLHYNYETDSAYSICLNCYLTDIMCLTSCFVDAIDGLIDFSLHWGRHCLCGFKNSVLVVSKQAINLADDGEAPMLAPIGSHTESL